jgi:hypothetical protein
MNSTEFFEKSFQKKNIPTCSLSILIGMDRFILGVMDGSGNPIGFRKRVCQNPSETAGLKDVLNLLAGEVLLSNQFSRIVVGLVALDFCAVPQRLFKPGTEDQYLRRLSNGEGHFLPRIHTLLGEDAVIIFPLENQVSEFFRHKQGQAQITPAIAWQIQFLREFLAAGTPKVISLNLFGNVLTSVLFHQQELVHTNRFWCSDTNDMLYFVWLLFEQFKLDRETQIHLTGEFTANSEHYRVLKRSFINISFGSLPFGTAVDELGKHVPGQELLPLLSLLKYTSA